MGVSDYSSMAKGLTNERVPAKNIMRRGNQAVVLPHQRGFASMTNWLSKTYRFTFDEALKRDYNTAKSMLNDAFIQGLLRNRTLPTAKSQWKIKATGPGASEEIERFYESALKQIPLWHDFRRNILQAVWHGRYGIQFATDSMSHDYRKFLYQGRPINTISHWLPHSGDKITFTWDGIPGIRINPMYVSDWKHKYGATVLQPNDSRLAQEAVSYRWTEEGPVMLLDNPEVRRKFAIPVFEVTDAPWDEPDMAGGVRGIGLRHYAFWAWDQRQEVVGWAMLHLEDFGAGGYTVVGYDGAEALKRNTAAFDNPETRVIHVPIIPGNDERITDMVTRLTPAGEGNDAIFQWAESYWNAHLTILFTGHPLNSQAAPTGMGSDMANKSTDILKSIQKSDAEVVDGTMTQEVLPVIQRANNHDEACQLEFVSEIREADKESGMKAAKQHFDMGGKVGKRYSHMISDVPEVEDGEDYLQSPQFRQQEQQDALMAQGIMPAGQEGGEQQQIPAQPPPNRGASKALKERGSQFTSKLAGTFPAGQRVTLEQARQNLAAQGVPDEEHMAALTWAVSTAAAIEHDEPEGVQYTRGPGAWPADGVVSYSTEGVDPASKWEEIEAPIKGGTRWKNIETGTITYVQPGAGRNVQSLPGDKNKPGKQIEKAQGGTEDVALLPGKGIATSGVEEHVTMLAQGGSKIAVEAGVLDAVRHVDKRLLKKQTVALAGRLGLGVSSKTSKTEALAYIEDTLRSKAKGKPAGETGTGNTNSKAMTSLPGEGGTKGPSPAVSENSPPRGGDGDRSTAEATYNAGLSKSPIPTDDEEEEAQAVTPAGAAAAATYEGDAAARDHAQRPREDGESLKGYLKRIGKHEHHEALSTYARGKHRQEKETVDYHNSAIKEAHEGLARAQGTKVFNMTQARKDGDYTTIPGFDTVAASVAANHPGIFEGVEAGYGTSGEETGLAQGHGEKLWDMLKEGRKPYRTIREHEDEAVAEHHEAGWPSIEPEEPAETDPRLAGEAAEPENADTSFDFGGNSSEATEQPTEVDSGTVEPAKLPETEQAKEQTGIHGETGNDSKEEGFMQQEKAGKYDESHIEKMAGQSFTNDKGLTVDLRKEEDGTYSIGSQKGLTQAGAAKHLNSIGAEKAQSLFGADVQAQGETQKPKEKLQWQEPTKKKDGPELPGMRDAFAPGMFGAAANQAEEQPKEIHEQVAEHFGIPPEAAKDALSTSFSKLQERDKAAEAIPSNHAEAPYTDYEKHELGTMRAANWNSNPKEAYVDYLTEHNPAELVTSEPEDGIKKSETYGKYAEWAKAGHEPPPISTSKAAKEGSKVVSSNRRRLLAAQEAGVEKIKAWHSPENPHTGNPLKYGDIIEHAKSLGWEEPAAKQPKESPPRGGEEPKQEAEKLPPGVSRSAIPLGLATSAHRGTSFVPEKRGKQRQEDYINQMQSDYEHLQQYATTEEAKKQLEEEFTRYAGGYAGHYRNALQAASRTMSSMIAGPANFPVERNRKKMETERRRYDDLHGYRERALRAIRKKLAPETVAIMAGQDNAVELLQKKAADLQTKQDTMKQANAHIRKAVSYNRDTREATFNEGHSLESLKEKLSAIGLGEHAEKLIKPDFAGRIGFPEYELTNNNANLKRIKGRIESVSKMKAGPAVEKTYSGGVTVEESPDDARIRIKFPGKPERSKIEELKKNGFRWSPSASAWQRQLNNAGRYAVESVLKSMGHELQPQEAPEEDEDEIPDTIVNDSLDADDGEDK